MEFKTIQIILFSLSHFMLVVLNSIALPCSCSFSDHFVFFCSWLPKWLLLMDAEMDFVILVCHTVSTGVVSAFVELARGE